MTMIQIEASTVAEILRATRALSGLTVRELAPHIGVSHGTISAWERGQGEPSVTQFLRWAEATKQPAQQLLDGLSVSRLRESNPRPIHYMGEGSTFWTDERSQILAALWANVEDGARV